ncbi:MAG TPA: hypothetical protein VFT49_04045 [Candidatus Saccharimonadales bacterium]|nr:hypothetical protein [Candidatus Saccharimonadales bacterium]
MGKKSTVRLFKTLKPTYDLFMRLNKFFLALLLSVLAASSSFALLRQDHAERFGSWAEVTSIDRVYIVIWWVALVNMVVWLTLSCISLGHLINKTINKDS